MRYFILLIVLSGSLTAQTAIHLSQSYSKPSGYNRGYSGYAGNYYRPDYGYYNYRYPYKPFYRGYYYTPYYAPYYSNYGNQRPYY